MHIPDSHPHLLVETLFEGTIPEEEFYSTVHQLGHFTRYTIQDYYSTELGLQRIDPDPIPGTPEELPGRIERFRGAVANGVHYTLARPYDEKYEVDALMELLVTYHHKNHDSAQEQSEAGSLEIVEFDVAKSVRGTGLGREMLKLVMARVKDDIPVTLTVAAPNAPAIAIYEHYGFEMYGEPVRHGVFDVEHLPMQTTSEDLKYRLGIETS